MISSELYGLYVVRPQDYDDFAVTALDLDTAAGVTAKVLTLNFPGAPLYFGFQPVVPFDYHALTTTGVLSLYLYPNGDASKKVLLGSINLEDGAVAHKQYMVKVANVPVAGTSAGHAKAPVANGVPQDKLAFWIDTLAVGDTYLLGTFQPVLIMQHRGEAFAFMPAWEDRTVAGAGISSAQ